MPRFRPVFETWATWDPHAPGRLPFDRRLLAEGGSRSSKPIALSLIDHLAAALLALARELPRLQVVDTRSTLIRGQPGTAGDGNDRQNAIRANGNGYTKLAARLRPALDALVLG